MSAPIEFIKRFYNLKEFTFLSTNYELVKEIVTRVNRKINFIIGGKFTKSNSMDIVGWETKNKLDIVIGEGDTIVADIIKGTLHESPIFETYNRKIYKVDKRSTYFPINISDLDLDRKFFVNEPTINMQNGEKEANIITSRGCIYDCKFCSAAVSLDVGNKARFKTSESIRKEIENLTKIYPDLQSIRILDDLFLINGKSIERVKQIFDGLDLNWRAMSHIQSIKKLSDDNIETLKNSGCSELSIGIESGNPNTLTSINKVNQVEDVITQISRLFEKGIGVKGYFIIGFSNETKESFEDSFQLAKKIKELSLKLQALFRISVFQFRPYHGTQLYNELVEEGKLVSEIKHTDNMKKGISEFDFSSGNYSAEDEKIVKEYIYKIRTLNELSQNFVPCVDLPKDEELKSDIYLVGLSYKLSKKGDILGAFDTSTFSGKLIDKLEAKTPNTIYKTNLVKGVPLKENGKIRYPNEDEKQKGLKILLDEIISNNPKYVILFGKQVFDFFIDNVKNLEKISEYEYKLWDTIIKFEMHPSYISVYKRNKKEEYIDCIIEYIS